MYIYFFLPIFLFTICLTLSTDFHLLIITSVMFEMSKYYVISDFLNKIKLTE